MAIVWATIENALRAWVKTGSGYADSKIIWVDQNGPRPANDFITLRIGDLVSLGAVDELRVTTNLANPNGSEIVLEVNGLREFTLSIQAFNTATVSTSTSREVLSKVQAALKLPSVRALLNAAGLGPFDMGSVKNISALLQTKFEARAILETRFYVNETVSENTGYINTVTLVDYTGNETIDI